MHDYNSFSIEGQHTLEVGGKDDVVTPETNRGVVFSQGGEIEHQVGGRACLKFQIDTKNYLMAWNGGSLVKVRKFVDMEGKEHGGGREEITDFSWKSSVSIKRTLGMVLKSCPLIYWVGTYPDEAYDKTRTGEWTVKTFDAFRERFRRKFPECGVIWRREHQRRKSGLYVGEFFPHMNFLIWGVDAGVFNRWVVKAWCDITGNLSEAQARAQWWAEPVAKWEDMVYYISKYVSKKNEDYFADPGWGAWWGKINSKFIPWAEPVRVDLTREQVNKILRYSRSYIRSKLKRKVRIRGNLPTRWITTGYPEFWLERLGDMVDLDTE